MHENTQKVSFYKNASEIRLFLKSDKTEAKLNFDMKIESETLLGNFQTLCSSQH